MQITSKNSKDLKKSCIRGSGKAYIFSNLSEFILCKRKDSLNVMTKIYWQVINI